MATAEGQDIEAQDGLTMSLRKRSIPRCVVDFYTQGGKFYRAEGNVGGIGVGDLVLAGRSVDMGSTVSNTLISCTTHKDIQNAAGSWSVVLPDRPVYQRDDAARHHNLERAFDITWQDALLPDDLAVIWMERPPRRREIVMVGLVGSRPRITREASAEGVIRTVQISGQDLGRAFLDAVIWYYKNTPGADPAAAMVGAAAQYPKFYVDYPIGIGTPGTILFNMFQNIFGVMAKQSFPGYAASFSKLINFVASKVPYQILVKYNVFQDEGPVWNLMKAVAEDPWYELFIDTVPMAYAALYTPQGVDVQTPTLQPNRQDASYNMLVFRQTPFDTADWQALPWFGFGEEVVIASDVGGSDDIKNFFYASPEVSMLSGAAQSPSAGTWKPNTASITAHGIRVYTPSFNGFDPNKLDVVAVAAQSQRLLNWFGHNESLLNGSFTIQGHSAPRIGCRARHTDMRGRRWEYYIEAVDQNFNALGEWTTTLTVTRGKPTHDQNLGFAGLIDAGSVFGAGNVPGGAPGLPGGDSMDRFA